ncbi:MAG: rubrerythrin family protein [Acidobacteria bacterium]|nr:rubrerythrin family protein [Acidobacteriota bacterium]
METTKREMLRAQRAELTEHFIYLKLAKSISNEQNGEILRRIAGDEKRHYDFWASLTGERLRPDRLRVAWYVWLARLLGVTFALKLMERGEVVSQSSYTKMQDVEGIERIVHDEEEHERELIDLLHDEPLEYAGSVVLGLNDALVELTGALAGLTLAFANGRVVAMAGLITGIAASLSMAASEYLSSKSEADIAGAGEGPKSPGKAAVYTGSAYVVAVFLLILPFFLLANVFAALAATLSVAVLIIAAFTYYISVARELRFLPRFLEMAGISLGVAAISFGIGFVVRKVFGVDL